MTTWLTTWLATWLTTWPKPSCLPRFALAAILVMLSPAAARAGGDAGAGKAVFNKVCASCHSGKAGVNGENAPSLFGVVGRKAGTAPGFDYSSAMKASGVVWNDETLDKFLRGPLRFIAGVRKTTFKAPSDDDRANVVAYLRTLK
ncbi:MAG: hypothetical protein RL477_535 [Pseudomonadota bacterium]|jgi:cytochrome c